MLKKWFVKKARFFYTVISSGLYKEMHSDKMLSFLSPLLVGWTYLPITDWAAGPEYYVHICNDIIINKKKSIVEMGSGISTIIIARLIKRNNLQARIVSIDHDAEWQNIVAQCLEADGVRDFVDFVCSPLEQKDDSSWYNTDCISLSENFIADTVIVDGPIGNVPMARYGAVPFMRKYLSSDCFTIYLHDTDREDEQKIVHLWGEILPNAKIEYRSRYAVFQSGVPYCFSPQNQA